MRSLAEEDRTMIIVTHELDFAREVSSRVIFLHDGRIEEQGHPNEIFDRPSSVRLRRFLGLHTIALPGNNGASFPELDDEPPTN